MSVSLLGMSSVLSLQEENRLLQSEVGRLEDLLAHSRAERDELAIKYSAVSERVRIHTHSVMSSDPNSQPRLMSIRRRDFDWISVVYQFQILLS